MHMELCVCYAIASLKLLRQVIECRKLQIFIQWVENDEAVLLSFENLPPALQFDFLIDGSFISMKLGGYLFCLIGCIELH